MPGGRIALLEETRKRLTMQQAEIVAVGPPAACECAEPCERAPMRNGRAVHPLDPRLVPGAWVLCAKWSYVGLPSPDRPLYAVRQEAIIGVFQDHGTSG